MAARAPLPALRAAAPPRGLPGRGAAFDRAWAPLAYEGDGARRSSRALKFRAALPVAGLMAAHMAANLPRCDLRRAVALVPVPAHRGRRRRRGFDPAALLAAGLAERAGLPLAAVPAAGRPRARARSARGACCGAARAASRPWRRAAPPRAAVLVDDVHTTGATLDACARALKDAGRGWVGAATYVRTL